MDIEFINNTVKGTDIKIGDTFTLEGVADIFICIGDEDILKLISKDDRYADYLHYTCDLADKSTGFLAFSLKTSCCYIFTESKSYIPLKVKVQAERC